MGESQSQPFQLSLNRFLRVAFPGSRVTSDGGLILVRELDERMGFGELIEQHLTDSRAKNARLPYADLLRQLIYSRLAGYEGGVADEWVTQLLRQGDAKVFKKYSQMKLQVKREALQKLHRKGTNQGWFWYRPGSGGGDDTVLLQFGFKIRMEVGFRMDVRMEYALE